MADDSGFDPTAKHDHTSGPWEPSEKGLAAARRHLGKRLKHERKKASLSVSQAADVAGVSKATYERFEAGTAIIRLPSLRALAVRYGCKMGDLTPNEQYLLAPKDPVRRLAWMRERNRQIQAGLTPKPRPEPEAG